MTEETKRRGRPPKVVADDSVGIIGECGGPEIDLGPRATKSEPVTDSISPREMTFAEVMAWNRANADLMPPPIELAKPKRPKSKRI